jgi:hypothetical protein
VTASETVLGWHFVRSDRRLRDGQLVEVGKTYEITGLPVLCERGCHASECPLDALKYATGPVLCRVRLGGVIVHGTDELAATQCTVLWMVDATRLLVEASCLWATLADAPGEEKR